MFALLTFTSPCRKSVTLSEHKLAFPCVSTSKVFIADRCCRKATVFVDENFGLQNTQSLDYKKWQQQNVVQCFVKPALVNWNIQSTA